MARVVVDDQKLVEHEVVLKVKFPEASEGVQKIFLDSSEQSVVEPGVVDQMQRGLVLLLDVRNRGVVCS